MGKRLTGVGKMKTSRSPKTKKRLAVKKAMLEAGAPAGWVEFFALTDACIVRGELDSDSRDLHKLIGLDTKTLRDVLA